MNASQANKVIQMYAHYFATAKQKYVIISETNRPVGVKIQVDGKRQARQLALQHNAQPWNF